MLSIWPRKVTLSQDYINSCSGHKNTGNRGKSCLLKTGFYVSISCSQNLNLNSIRFSLSTRTQKPSFAKSKKENRFLWINGWVRNPNISALNKYPKAYKDRKCLQQNTGNKIMMKLLLLLLLLLSLFVSFSHQV